ncbi:MAG: hypothetical protein JRN15_13995 [Nitrososphaerota archaeon]|nr:hypothetical protein [Nitrososphaerota archaeon]
MKVDLEEEQIKKFLPTTVRKRMALLQEIVTELNRRNFKHLDETNTEDFQRVVSIIEDMHPESNYYTVRHYAKVAIRLWNKERGKQGEQK